MTEPGNADIDAGVKIKRSSVGLIVVWAVLIVVSVLYWHFFGMLPALGEHWPLTALMVLVGLMIAGKIGSGLGIPLLFRNAPDKGRRFSPSFWSGFGVTLLCTLILTVMFVCSWLTLLQNEVEFQRLHNLMNTLNGNVFLEGPTEYRATAAPSAARLMTNPRLPEDVHLTGKSHDWRPHSLITRQFLRRHGITAERGKADPMSVPAFLFVLLAGLPLWVLLAACVIGADPPSVGLSSPRSMGSRFHEALGYFLGWSLMLAVTTGFAVLLLLLEPTDSSGEPSAVRGWWLLDGLLLFTRFQSWAHLGSFVSFVSFVILLPVTVTLFYRNIPPALGICLLLCLAAVLYLCLDVLSPGIRVVVASFIGAAVVFINRRADRYRFPGMTWHYDAPIDLEGKDQEVEEGKIPPGPCADDGVTPLFLNDRQVLDEWAKHVQSLCPDCRTKPKLVLLAVTGAAYRASFWTTIVLERLGEEFPGFFDHVRLVTGASGGMVGAAYAVAMKSKKTAGRARNGASSRVTAASTA